MIVNDHYYWCTSRRAKSVPASAPAATMSMKTDNGSRQDGPILQQADNNLGRLSEKNITTIKSNFIVQNKRNDLNLNLNEMEIQFDGKVRLGV